MPLLACLFVFVVLFRSRFFSSSPYTLSLSFIYTTTTTTGIKPTPYFICRLLFFLSFFLFCYCIVCMYYDDGF
ncbi:hypothetical protein C8J57DRAFT_1391140, partial [Mycena rebaudengoi]